ncbi:MAG: hypothetical protein WKF40_05165 [Thermoleophilaceae bacterium]
MNGSPVIAPLTCPSGGQGRKVGVMPAAGLAYILNSDGTSCQAPAGRTQHGVAVRRPRAGPRRHALPAVGLPAFGTVAGRTAFVGPVAGLVRALDVVAPEYQGGADATAAWNPETGQYLPGFPAQQNDLAVPHRSGGGRRGRDPRGGDSRRHVQHGPSGLQRRGRLDKRPLAAAPRRLDGDHAARRVLRRRRRPRARPGRSW